MLDPVSLVSSADDNGFLCICRRLWNRYYWLSFLELCKWVHRETGSGMDVAGSSCVLNYQRADCPCEKGSEIDVCIAEDLLLHGSAVLLARCPLCQLHDFTVSAAGYIIQVVEQRA